MSPNFSVVPASFVKCQQSEHAENPAHERWLVGPDGNTWCEGELRQKLGNGIAGTREFDAARTNWPLTLAHRDLHTGSPNADGEPEWAHHLLNPLTHDYYEDPVQVEGMDYDFTQLREIAAMHPTFVDPRSGARLPAPIQARPNLALRDICAQVRGAPSTDECYGPPAFPDLQPLHDANARVRHVENTMYPSNVVDNAAWLSAIRELESLAQRAVLETQQRLAWWPDDGKENVHHILLNAINAIVAAGDRTPKRLKKRCNAISASTCISAASAAFITTNLVVGPSLATASVAAVSAGLLASFSFVREDVMRFGLVTGGDRGDLMRGRLHISPETAFGICVGSLGGSIAAVGIHLLLAYPRRNDVHVAAPINAAFCFTMWVSMMAVSVVGNKVFERTLALQRYVSQGHKLVQRDLE